MNNGMGMLKGTPGVPMGEDYGPTLGKGLGDARGPSRENDNPTEGKTEEQTCAEGQVRSYAGYGHEQADG